MRTYQAIQLRTFKKLIHRTCNRVGFNVLEAGKARKAEARLDLEGLYREAGE